MDELIAGIDYSMTSPAICVGKPSDSFDDCFLFCYSKDWKDDAVANIEVERQKFTYTQPVERFDELSEWAMNIINNYNVKQVALEGYSYGSSKSNLFDIGENGGVLKHKLFLSGVGVTSIAPKTVKKFGAGNGNANKDLMYEAFVEKTGRDLKKMFYYQKKNLGSPIADVVDAYFVWEFYVKNLLQTSSTLSRP